MRWPSSARSSKRATRRVGSSVTSRAPLRGRANTMNDQHPSSGAPVLLVAGGTRGIGAAIVARARARGARVAYCGRSVPESGDVDGSMCGRNLLALRADIAREDDVDRVFEQTLAA